MDTSIKAVLENVVGNFVYDKSSHDKKERMLQEILILQVDILNKINTLLERISNDSKQPR